MIKQTLRPFHTQIRFKKAPAKTQAKVYFVGSSDKKKVATLLKKWATPWQQKLMLDSQHRAVMHFSHKEGPVWILVAPGQPQLTSHEGRLEDSEYAWARDHVGSLLAQWRAYKVKTVSFEFHETSPEQERGALVGLGLAAYSFKNSIEDKDLGEPTVFVTKSKGEVDKTLAEDAAALAHSVNWARHLVNMPPNWLNPKTYAELVVGLFKGSKHVKVEVWDEKRLAKEGMGLHLGVGQGAANPPCLVHIRYRPGKTSQSPIALVGKGITFDSGGLDIKPSSGMRLMKKDMGGSAAVVGTMLWAEGTDYQRPLDAYIALAENAVDAKSMRPSDVLVARNGMKVEIHNTDAEGRLVLADALDVAVTAKGNDAPEMVINLATLTGAIKVALGADIAGLFSNHDHLSHQLEKSGQAVGELSWRMPLYSRYSNGMSSAFGDMVNAVDGFGGAITAALFLEKFVKQKPWAHLDIYAWNDKPTGALTFSGGSGQGVQTLAQFLKEVE